MSERTVVNPEAQAAPFGVWSPAIVAEGGQLVFLSGITSRDADGSVVGEGDIEVQTRQVCENIKATIQAAGGSLEDIASVTVHVTDITEFDTIHAVRREYWPEDPPASTMVEVSRMVDPRSMIEITAVAVL